VRGFAEISAGVRWYAEVCGGLGAKFCALMWLKWRRCVEVCGDVLRYAEECEGVWEVVCGGVRRCAEHNLAEMGEMEEVCGGVRRVEEKCWRCEVVCGGMRRYENLPQTSAHLRHCTNLK